MSSNTSVGSWPTRCNFGRRLAMDGPPIPSSPMQCAATDQVFDLDPHCLPLGIGFAHVTEALRPEYAGRLFDWNIDASDDPTGFDHQRRHGGDGIVELGQGSHNPECIMRHRNNPDASLIAGDSGQAHTITAASLVQVV